MTVDIALVSLLIVVGLLVAQKLERYWLSLPIVFVAAGAVFGQHGLDWLHVSLSSHLALEVTELTLALLLFADSSTLRIRSVAREAGLESRLLSIGLLLSVILGTALAWLVFDNIEFGLALLIGASLAPTDLALGLPIVNNQNIPARIRQALNVEGGLNDGIVTPIVTLAIAITISESGDTNEGWLADAAQQIGIALLVAAVVGYVGGNALRLALQKGWTTTTYGELIFFAFAAIAFFGARELDGNGFVAAFVGGMITAAALGEPTDEVYEFTETVGSGLSYFVWIMFGAALVPLAMEEFFSWRAVGFALLALTVMRMLPVVIALIGTGLRPDTQAIMGWFGPRGLASVVFMVTAIVAFEEAGFESGTLIGAMAWTVLLSVVLHGITAVPFGAWYGRRMASADPSIPEFEGAGSEPAA